MTLRKFFDVTPPVWRDPGMNSTRLNWNRAPSATAKIASTSSDGANSRNPSTTRSVQGLGRHAPA
jgi:hypothetical protein